MFELPKLDYSNTALSPIMSEQTLDLHHGKHHQTYITNLNNFIKNTEYEKLSLEEVITKSSKENKPGIFNNASQHWNHTQFWKMMGPSKNTMPSELENAVKDQFVSVDQFKKDFCNAGATQFGSGWCWLVKENDGTLKITKTENGVNPICFNQKALLGCDVWEHSYYLDYKNKRPAYLENFFDKLINWDFVESNL